MGLVGGIVALVFIFKPGWKPQASPDVDEGDDQRHEGRPAVHLQALPAAAATAHLHEPLAGYLARSGVMIPFHYEIIGLRGKKLPLRWELSDAETNDLIASEDSAYRLTPSNNDEAADWSGVAARAEARPRLLRHRHDLPAEGPALRAEALRLADVPGSGLGGHPGGRSRRPI